MTAALTKDDLLEALAPMRQEMTQGFAAVRQEMADGTKSTLATLRQEMANGNASIRQEMADGFMAVRQEITEATTSIKDEIIEAGAEQMSVITDSMATKDDVQEIVKTQQELQTQIDSVLDVVGNRMESISLRDNHRTRIARLEKDATLMRKTLAIHSRQLGSSS